MHELERRSAEFEKAGIAGRDYDHDRAVIFSRLFIVKQQLKEEEDAKRYHEKAVSAWKKDYIKLENREISEKEANDHIESTITVLGDRPLWLKP